jgi:subtilisin family serine protease
VLCVAATAQDDSRAGFSNFGTWVDVAAPGVALRTTTTGGGYTTGFGGTSGATPQVAGLAALLMGSNPNLTNAQPVPSKPPRLGLLHLGMINCDRLPGRPRSHGQSQTPSFAT